MARLSINSEYFSLPGVTMLRAMLGDSGELLPFRLWCVAARRAPGGSFPAEIAREIEMSIGWAGESGHAISALTSSGFISTSEGKYTITDWSSISKTSRVASAAAKKRWNQVHTEHEGEHAAAMPQHCCSIAAASTSGDGGSDQQKGVFSEKTGKTGTVQGMLQQCCSNAAAMPQQCRSNAAAMPQQCRSIDENKKNDKLVETFGLGDKKEQITTSEHENIEPIKHDTLKNAAIDFFIKTPPSYSPQRPLLTAKAPINPGFHPEIAARADRLVKRYAEKVTARERPGSAFLSRLVGILLEYPVLTEADFCRAIDNYAAAAKQTGIEPKYRTGVVKWFQDGIWESYLHGIPGEAKPAVKSMEEQMAEARRKNEAEILRVTGKPSNAQNLPLPGVRKAQSAG